MSTPRTMKTTERIQGQGGPGRGGPFGGPMIGQKSMDFGPSAKRLLRRLRPELARVIAVIVLGRVQRRSLCHRSQGARARRPT